MAYLKICGLMRTEDVTFCCACGVELIGFVVEYLKDVPWNLDVAQAQALFTHLSAQSRSVVVTGGAPEAVLRRAEALHPSFVQLHYRETPEETRWLAERLHMLGIGVIKAIPVRADGTPDVPDFASVVDMAACYAQTGADLLLLDARVPSVPDVQGMPLDAALYLRVRQRSAVPVVLAGGLTAENLARILRETNAPVVDILSGAETAHGIKNRAAIRQLCRIVKEALSTS